MSRFALGISLLTALAHTVSAQQYDITVQGCPSSTSECLADLAQTCKGQPRRFSTSTELGVVYNGPLYNNLDQYPACNLSAWDVSQVTNLDDFFSGVQFSSDADFNLSGWDTSQVATAVATFNNSNFNFAIDSWDVSSLYDANSMFRNSSFNQPLNNWTVTALIDARYMTWWQVNRRFNEMMVEWAQRSLTALEKKYVSTLAVNKVSAVALTK